MTRMGDLEKRMSVVEANVDEWLKRVKIEKCEAEAKMLLKEYWDFALRLDRARRDQERDELTGRDIAWFEDMKVERDRLKGVALKKNKELRILQGIEK